MWSPQRTFRPSFVNGELAPSLYGRVDLARWHSGLRVCENFVVRPQGGLRNRPGTVLCGDLWNDVYPSRLVPFIFGVQDSYVLEFADQRIRFWRYGELLRYGDGQPYEVATPYHWYMLPDLRFVQSADVLTIVHPDVSPMELRRHGEMDWELKLITFAPEIEAPGNLRVTHADQDTGPREDHTYVVTAVSEATGEESVASNPVTVNSYLAGLERGQNDHSISLAWDEVPGASYYNIYRSDGSTTWYGYVGSSEGPTFTDKNFLPDLTRTPPGQDNPFEGASDKPRCVTYYQQRRVFAGTDNAPQAIFMTAAGNFRRFGSSRVPRPDDPVIFQIASQQVNTIVDVVPLGILLALTTGGIIAIGPGGDEPVTPTNIRAVPQDYVEVSPNTPALLVGHAALFVERKGSHVRELAYSLDADARISSDLSVLSEHLVEGYEIWDWAYQRRPDSTVWMVRSDGTLLGLTYIREHQVVAWHRHTTRGGSVESVCVVPEGGEDAVYLAVRRTLNGAQRRVLERMVMRGDQAPLGGIFLDCAIWADGTNYGDTTITVSLLPGEDWQIGGRVRLEASDDMFSSTDVGSQIWFRKADGTPCRVQILEPDGNTRALGELLDELPEEFRDTPRKDWEQAFDYIHSVGHLIGEEVYVQADGNALGPFTPDTAMLKIGVHAVKIAAGIPYTAAAETLEITDQTGAMMSERKRIGRAWLEVNASKGLWVGVPGHLQEARPKRRKTYWEPVRVEQGLVEVRFPTNWSQPGRLRFEARLPLPVEVVGVSLEVDLARR